MDDGFGHIAECHERPLPGVALENPKAAGGEHPLRVLKSHTETYVNFGEIFPAVTAYKRHVRKTNSVYRTPPGCWPIARQMAGVR